MDIKKHWRILNTVCNRTKCAAIPTWSSMESLADEFNLFFHDKTEKIRVNLMKSPTTISAMITPIQPVSLLRKFNLVTQIDVLRTIRQSPKSTSPKDPLPSWLLSRCTQSLLPSLTHIVNMSILHGMPKMFKEAVVTPLLKKPSLNKEDMGNYRPISNLFFLSKVIERLISSQIVEHLKSNSFLDIYQSAYREFHSTETLLLHLLNDVYLSIDNNCMVILVLLDMSSAFDTVEHDSLLQTLSTLGIVDDALEWIQKYLYGRSQVVSVNKVLGTSRAISSGVPQGSVLGPLLFTLYINDIGKIISSHGVKYHCYADDIQLYMSSSPRDIPVNIAKLESCIQDIISFLSGRSLSINGSKSELILLGNKSQHSQCSQVEIKIGNTVVQPSEFVRDLGVYLDKHLL
jgi:hypothetical protein